MEIENLSKEEILKLIEENKNKDDAKSLYFLSKLYLKIQDYTNALICVVDCLNKDSSYYYDCIDIKLTCLIEKEKYIEALKILDEELSMPFIPRDYEDKFKEKYKFLNSKFNSNNKSNPISELSDEEIGDLLLNIKDTQTLLTIIEVLEKRNIRNFISYIQKYLISENSEIIKSLLLLKLKDQKVDSSIKIKKNELEIELIPSNLSSINELDSFNKIIKIIDDFNTDFNITIEEISNTYLNLYMLYYYPIDISIDEYEYIAIAIYNKALEILSINTDISRIIKDYSLNKKILDEYCKRIEKISVL